MSKYSITETNEARTDLTSLEIEQVRPWHRKPSDPQAQSKTRAPIYAPQDDTRSSPILKPGIAHHSHSGHLPVIGTTTTKETATQPPHPVLPAVFLASAVPGSSAKISQNICLQKGSPPRKENTLESFLNVANYKTDADYSPPLQLTTPHHSSSSGGQAFVNCRSRPGSWRENPKLTFRIVRDLL